MFKVSFKSVMREDRFTFTAEASTIGLKPGQTEKELVIEDYPDGPVVFVLTQRRARENEVYAWIYVDKATGILGLTVWND